MVTLMMMMMMMIVFFLGFGVTPLSGSEQVKKRRIGVMVLSYFGSNEDREIFFSSLLVLFVLEACLGVLEKKIIRFIVTLFFFFFL